MRTNEPQPRVLPLELPKPWRPPTTSVSFLDWEPGPEAGFRSVLEQRQSVRQLGVLPRAKLGTLLWHAARIRSNERREDRPAPSAGGLHPIAIVVLEPPFSRAQLYDPLRHALGELAGLDQTNLEAASRPIVEILSAPSTVILTLANFQLSEAYYSNSESLVWRDAGCMLATLHLTACWLGLGSCLLGALGNGVASIVSPDGIVCGTGAIAVGEPAADVD